LNTDFNEPLALADFEHWIASNLNIWLDSTEKTENMCAQLRDLLDKYLTTIMEVYRGCCERFSMGILTTLEIWVALDKIQCALNHSLIQYSPGISPRVLQPLLLRKRDHLERLLAVKEHLIYRNSTTTELFPNMDSFCENFFDQSEPHQRELSAIEGEATTQRQQKTTEWQAATEMYESLLQDARECDHDYTTNDDEEVHDPSSCEKCMLESEAGDMKIVIYEWPLPENKDAQKVLVVELNPPAGFRAWRDATWRIIQDLGRQEVVLPETKRQEPKQVPGSRKEAGDLFLSGYNALSGRGIRNDGRIMLRAKKKPTQLHGRKSKRMPLELEDICVENTSTWDFYDKQKAAWISDQKDAPDFRRYCTYELPAGPYRSLQWVMSSPNYTDNEILARPADCPSDLSLREFYAFGSLRAGRRIQIANILRALAVQSLNIKSLAVQTLIVQAIWEFDPSYEGDRKFSDPSLCRLLLLVLENIMDQMAFSLCDQNIDALISVAILILRTLSLTDEADTRVMAIGSLRKLRECGMRLLRRLSNGSSSLSVDEPVAARTILSFKTVCLVKMTFDVDVRHIDNVLRDSEDVETFATASLLMFENTPAEIGSLQPCTKEMLLRGLELSTGLEKHLRAMLPEHSDGLTAALFSRCDGLTLQDKWSFLSREDNPWVECQTSDRRVLHYNTLTGEVLVEGRHIQKVPPEIERDPWYQRVIGNVSNSWSALK
jgi:hypothetical protein